MRFDGDANSPIGPSKSEKHSNFRTLSVAMLVGVVDAAGKKDLVGKRDLSCSVVFYFEVAWKRVEELWREELSDRRASGVDSYRCSAWSRRSKESPLRAI